MMVAKKTVAHNLARACFYVLRNDVEFDVIGVSHDTPMTM